MKTFKKLIASALALAVAIPMFTACSRGGGGDVISADDPWYDLKTVSIEETFDPEVYEFAYIDFVGLCDLGYVYSAYAVKLIESGEDIESNYADMIEQSLFIYDDEGTRVQTISISDCLKNSDVGEYASLSGVVEQGGTWYVKITSYDSDTFEPTNYRIAVDMESGELGEPELIPTPEEVGDLISEASEEDTVTVGDYEIRKFWCYSDEGDSYVFILTDSDNNTTVIDMRELFPNETIFDVANIIDIGNNKALICATDSGASKFFTIDFTTMNVEKIDGDMSWLPGDASNIFAVEGIGSAIVNQDGVYAIDFDSSSLEPLLLFDDTNVNRSDVNNFTPIRITEDEFVFTGVPNMPEVGSGTSTTSRAGIYTFTRAESNPNAGKTIISVASVESFPYALCNAVCEFNDSSENYFIKLDSKYNIDQHSGEFSNADDYQAARDRVSADLSNQLAIDLMAGEGPDVIINAASLTMMNNSDYLLDLAPYVQENYGSDNYFTNIFDACKDGEALYQIPLAFSVIGIATSQDNVEDGQNGFTFEQYADFVEGPCNGVSPFSGNQIDIFIRLVDCMYDSFIEEGIVNFDTEEFRALADFTAENITDELSLGESGDEGYYETDSSVASIEYIDNISSYFQSVSGKDNVLLGLPSYDGRGPVIYDINSVAISAQTDNQDACYEFVSMLLSDSCQEIYAVYNIPVNRNAFDTVAHEYMETTNYELDLMLRLYDEALLTMYGYNTAHMEESDIPEFEEFVEGISRMYVNDGSINSIIREEMPSYFAGQKTMEQIIPVLTDRVSTVLNERS